METKVKWPSGRGIQVGVVLEDVNRYWRVRVVESTSRRKIAVKVGETRLILKILCTEVK